MVGLPSLTALAFRFDQEIYDTVSSNKQCGDNDDDDGDYSDILLDYSDLPSLPMQVMKEWT